MDHPGDRPVEATLSDALAPAETGGPELPLPDERPGQYRRLDELGRGGQSVVWRAVDDFVGREVALKELLGAHGPSTAKRRRFLREALLTARLDHPGIVSVLEVARRPDGSLFCAQKLVRGETLKARLERCSSLAERLALLPHLIDATRAVAYAHARGVVHRDLKPSNIMVGTFGETIVVDWGLAKQRGESDLEDAAGEEVGAPALTVAGVALGTPAYMSPEQARGENEAVDERSDVFSLGVILYELLTGRRPFEGGGALEIIARVATGRFRPVRELAPAAPADLAAVAERALAAAPADRYPNAEALVTDLLAYRIGGRVAAYEYNSWDLVRRFVARNRTLSIVTVAAVLALLGAAIVIAQELRATRRNLAAAFLERARSAAASADWARAAGYYAAARTQEDSREGRWGYALAHEKMPRLLSTLRGAPGDFASVTTLPDGDVLAIRRTPSELVGFDVDAGRELWRFPAPKFDRFVTALPGRVRVLSLRATVELDAASGRAIGAPLASDEASCPGGPLEVPLRLRERPGELFDLTYRGVDDAILVLQSVVLGQSVCAVAPDGKRAAALDASGLIHVWALPAGTEIAARPAPDASQLFFTAHGLAVVRSGSLQVFGGEEGDFLIPLPRGGGNGLMDKSAAGMVAPGGHVLILPRLGDSQADVIDLREHAIVESLAFPEGVPRLAVSPEGARLYLAGVEGGSVLSSWNIAPLSPPPAIAGSARMAILPSDDGSRILVKQSGPWRVEVYDRAGRMLRGIDPGVARAVNAILSLDGKRVAVAAGDRLSVHDVDTGTVLADWPCRRCMRLAFSRTGERLVSNNMTEVDLWEVGHDEPIWRERGRVGRLADPLHISADGSRVLWGEASSIHIRSETGDLEIAFEPEMEDAVFDPSGTRVVAATQHSIASWSLSSLRTIFNVPNPAKVAQEIGYSSDGTALYNMRDSLGTALLDSATGATFAFLPSTHVASSNANDIVTADLTTRIIRGNQFWSIAPMPRPDDGNAEDSLAKVMAEAGLALDGVELRYRGR